MNNNIIFLILYICFAVIIFLFFFNATKAMFDADSLFIKLGQRDADVLKLGKKKVNKPLKAIGITISTIFCVALVGTSIGLLILKTCDKPFNYVDYMALAVTSGSMEAKDEDNKYLVENNLNNQFPTGSTILLTKVPEQKDIKKYDVIAYKNKEGTIVIHRIINFGYYDDNGYFYMTDDVTKATKFIFRGDNNDANDANYVDYDQFYGKYTNYYIPYVGYFIEYAQSYFGLVSLVAIAAIIESYEFFERKNLKVLKERYELISGDFSAFVDEPTDNTDELENLSNNKEETASNVNNEEDDSSEEELPEIYSVNENDEDVENNEVENEGDKQDEDSSEPLLDANYDDIVITDELPQDKESDPEVEVKLEEKPKETIKNNLTINLNEDRESEGIRIVKDESKDKKHLLREKLDKSEYIRQVRKDERARKKTIKRFKR